MCLGLHILLDLVGLALNNEVSCLEDVYVLRLLVLLLVFVRIHVTAEEFKSRKSIVTSHTPVWQQHGFVFRLIDVQVSHSIVVLLYLHHAVLFRVMHVWEWQLVSIFPWLPE